jgi:hypothetical protein
MMQRSTRMIPKMGIDTVRQEQLWGSLVDGSHENRVGE